MRLFVRFVVVDVECFMAGCLLFLLVYSTLPLSSYLTEQAARFRDGFLVGML